jgi:hypothetical protein
MANPFTIIKNLSAGYDAGKKIVAATKVKKAKDATEAALKAKQKAEEVIRLAKIAKEAKRVAGLEKKAATLKTLKVAAGTGVAGVAAGAYMNSKYNASSAAKKIAEGKKLKAAGAAMKIKGATQKAKGTAMKIAGSQMKMGGGVKKKFDDGGPTDPNKYVMNKTNAFGNSKFKEISKNKFDRVSNRYSNQKGSESLGTNESINQQVISGKNKKNYVSRADEVRRAESNKKLAPRVSPTKIVPPTKASVPLMKKGGTTKAAKFAALAPPYNKATAADRIVGAKKNMRKKK